MSPSARAVRRKARRAHRRLQQRCIICPANSMPAGRFDVCGTPRPTTSYHQVLRVRIDAESRVPVCVHPDRVGMRPGRYASDGVPVPVLTRLRVWLASSLRR